ncbi:MAG: two-component regulator propeller domain-containing protein [Bryobacteraceae bacterium]|jgi:signal transduction histidine kinase/ligand-binding sensor domain-containing protein
MVTPNANPISALRDGDWRAAAPITRLCSWLGTIFHVLFLLALLIEARPLAAAAGAGLPSGVPGYGIDIWREPEGLPQSRIRAIVQTHDGYLWLGTDGGAVRFNGASFRAFTVETGSLKDNEVWALQEDDEHALWIGTYGGGLTRFKDGRFRTFTTADGLPDDVVTHIEKDASGDLWIATARGFSRYSHGRFTRIEAPGGSTGVARDAICARSPGSVYVATGSQVLRYSDGGFQPLAGIVGKGDGSIERLACAIDSSLWIGFSSGVVKNWKNGAVATFRPHPGPSIPISLLYEDPSGGVWAATGRTIYRLRNGRFERLPLQDERTSFSKVYSMYVDREGSIWVGLLSNGLARLRVKPLSALPAPQGLPNDIARSVFEDRRGDVWVGNSNGFGQYRAGMLVSYTKLPEGRSGPVWSFAEDPQGRLWIAAGRDLLLREEGRLTDFPGWRPSSAIAVIYRDAVGGMWVGTDWDGLYQWTGRDFRNYRTQDGLAGNRIRALLRDRQGALWISAVGAGVSRFFQGTFTNFGTAAGLAGNRVHAIHEDVDGTLWFATRGGLSRLRDGKFFSYTSASGLLVNFVYSILDDGLGNFWFSSSQGLFKVSKADLADFAAGRIRKVTSVSYGVRDGMRTRAGNVGNQPVAWKTTDGSLLFSTLEGVVVVTPNRLTASSYVPPVYIESVSVNRQKQQTGGEPSLPVGAGEVEINYTALSYLNPEKVRYKYMLTGFDADWVDAGDRSFAYYANLPPGDFRFRVIAGSVDGQWNQQGASFAFHLQPRFYNTRLFWGVCAAVLLLIAWLLYRLRIYEIKATYLAVLAERHRISQDLHDTFAQNLAGIALQLDSITMQLEEIPPGVKSRLDEACVLTRYSLAEARRAVSDLRSDELEGAELTAALPEIASRLVGGGGVRTVVTVAGTPQQLSPVARKAVVRIFQEAMANALKHAHAETIEIQLRYENEGLVLAVRDDGRGFDAASAIPLTVGHYGLTGMRERAERIGGRMTLTSAPGLGTELAIFVPFAECADTQAAL